MFFNALLIGILLVAGVLALFAATRQADSHRRSNLRLRPPFPFNEWQTLNPNADAQSLRSALLAIASGLSVEGQNLRPNDRFDGSLALKGPFIIDDDTVEIPSHQFCNC